MPEEAPLTALTTGYIDDKNGNTLTNVYDAMGQYWFAGVSVGF